MQIIYLHEIMLMTKWSDKAFEEHAHTSFAKMENAAQTDLLTANT